LNDPKYGLKLRCVIFFLSLKKLRTRNGWTVFLCFLTRSQNNVSWILRISAFIEPFHVVNVNLKASLNKIIKCWHISDKIHQPIFFHSYFDRNHTHVNINGSNDWYFNIWWSSLRLTLRLALRHALRLTWRLTLTTWTSSFTLVIQIVTHIPIVNVSHNENHKIRWKTLAYSSIFAGCSFSECLLFLQMFSNLEQL